MQNQSTKVCNKCLREKPVEKFCMSFVTVTGKLVKHASCNTCKNAAGRKNRHRYNRSDKGRKAFHALKLKSHYGMSVEEYDALLEKQNHRCAICSQEETIRSGVTGKLHDFSVDHDHETGKVRGLLCGNCNRGLGLFRDNPRLLFLAGHYLCETAVRNRQYSSSSRDRTTSLKAST